jgi:hypothetical protein
MAEVSSTFARRCIDSGEYPENVFSPSVAEYIKGLIADENN